MLVEEEIKSYIVFVLNELEFNFAHLYYIVLMAACLLQPIHGLESIPVICVNKLVSN